MKSAFFSLFLLSAFTSLFPSLIAGVIFDTDGEYLRNGGTYYILPAYRGMGGGVELDTTGNETCPLSVVQAPFEISKGLPLRISSPYLTTFINEGFPLSLEFLVVPPCAPTPSRWTVVEEAPKRRSVKITGYENIAEGTFHIEDYDRDYKLVFCAKNRNCNAIGIYIDDDGKRRLVATNKRNAFKVVFQRVNGLSVV